MEDTSASPRYKRHRPPPEIISSSVWLYFRFAPNYRAHEIF